MCVLWRPAAPAELEMVFWLCVCFVAGFSTTVGRVYDSMRVACVCVCVVAGYSPTGGRVYGSMRVARARARVLWRATALPVVGFMAACVF